MDCTARACEEKRICRLVLGDPEYKARGSVFIYASYGSEVSTETLIEAALSEEKKVYLPRVTDAEAGIMSFFKISGVEDLETGYRGIPEPVTEDGFDGDYEDVFMVVPGAAFNKEGHRIGYGRGFYDRYLNDKTGIYKVGVCFSCQMTETIPADAFDVKMDRVVTGTS